MHSHSATYWLLLTLLGLAIGCFGTLIGAGGGFILMPILVLLYPEESPEILASISLAVVFCNAASGSVGYALQRKIDYRAGLVFSAAAVPGAVLGALTTEFLPRRAFDMMLGVLLIAAAVFLAFSGVRRATARHGDPGTGPEGDAGSVVADKADLRTPRIVYAKERGAAISFGVGFISSLLGVGGGIIHVPALVLVLGFPVHVATATSHFVLAATSFAGTAAHAATGTFGHGWRRTAALGIGVLIGAQLGARLARHTPPAVIIRGLAVALALVGARIVVLAFQHT